MEASAPPRRRPEEDEDEGEPDEEDCLRLHGNIWIHTRGRSSHLNPELHARASGFQLDFAAAVAPQHRGRIGGGGELELRPSAFGCLLGGRWGMPCAVALWWEVKIYDTVGGTRFGSMPVGLKLLLGPEGRDTVPGRWLFRGWL